MRGVIVVGNDIAPSHHCFCVEFRQGEAGREGRNWRVWRAELRKRWKEDRRAQRPSSRDTSRFVGNRLAVVVI
jgi:hypothetical protein